METNEICTLISGQKVGRFWFYFSSLFLKKDLYVLVTTAIDPSAYRALQSTQCTVKKDKKRKVIKHFLLTLLLLLQQTQRYLLPNYYLH